MNVSAADDIVDLDIALSFSGSGASTATDKVRLPPRNMDALIFDVEYKYVDSGGFSANTADDFGSALSECRLTSNFDNVSLFNLTANQLNTYCNFMATQQAAMLRNSTNLVEDGGQHASNTTTFARFVLYHKIDKLDNPDLEMTVNSALFAGGAADGAWSATVKVGAIYSRGDKGGRQISDIFTESATTTNNVNLPAWPVAHALIVTTTRRDLTRIAFPNKSIDNPGVIQGAWEANTSQVFPDTASEGVTSVNNFVVANQPAAPGKILRVDGATSEARTFYLSSPVVSPGNKVIVSGGVPTAGPARPVGGRPTKPLISMGNLRLGGI